MGFGIGGGVSLGLGPTLAYPRLSLDGGFCPSIERTGIHRHTYDAYIYVCIVGEFWSRCVVKFVVNASWGMAIK